MRFLKRQTINRRQLKSTTVYSDVDDVNVYVQPKNAGSMVLPRGNDAQMPTGINGMIRYNTQHNEVQVYQSDAWRSLRFKESTGITQQNLGAGDGGEVYFGPLNPAPTMSPDLVQSGSSWGGQNLLVVVENVLQLHTQNYTVVQNPVIGAEESIGVVSAEASAGATTLYFSSGLKCLTASGDGTTVTLTFSNRLAKPFAVGSNIVVTGFTPAGYNGTYAVVTCSTNSVTYLNTTTAAMSVAGEATSTSAVYPSTNFVNSTVSGTNIPGDTHVVSYTVDVDTDALVSANISNPTSGVVAVNTPVTLTEGATSGSGWYLKFSSPVPYGKIVTVLHGFDK